MGWMTNWVRRTKWNFATLSFGWMKINDNIVEARVLRGVSKIHSRKIIGKEQIFQIEGLMIGESVKFGESVHFANMMELWNQTFSALTVWWSASLRSQILCSRNRQSEIRLDFEMCEV
jgi:hypothetical protein